MQLPMNVDRSPAGGYIAYDGLGYPWRVAKTGAGWRASPGNNHPGRLTVASLRGSSLSGLAAELAARKPAVVVEPF